MAPRWFSCLAFLSLLALLSTAAARQEQGKDKPEEELSEEPRGSVWPVPNVGGHSGFIGHMVFDRTGERLYTAGYPGDVQEWDVDTGERLRVWRFPHYAVRVALSADGKQLAVGCVSDGPDKSGTARARVWLIDQATGKARVADVVEARKQTKEFHVQQVAFSPSGDRLAVNAVTDVKILPLKGGGAPIELANAGYLFSMAFDPSGTRLLTARHSDGKVTPQVRIFDVGPRGAQKPPLAFPETGPTPMAAWSPKGSRMAGITGGTSPSFHVWTLGGKPKAPDWSLDRQGLLKQLGDEVKKGTNNWVPLGVVFRSEKEVLACWEQAGWVRIVLFDTARKQARLLPEKISRQTLQYGGMALSHNGRLLAVTANPNYRVAVYDLQQGRRLEYRHPETRKRTDVFGSPVGRPAIVGWTRDGNGIVWGYRPPPAKREQRQEFLQEGLILTTQKRLPRKECIEAARAALPKGWKVAFDKSGQAILFQKDKKIPIALRQVRADLTRSFKDRSGKVWLLVAHGQGRYLAKVDPSTGRLVAPVGFLFRPVYDLAVSPDDRYLLVAGGEQALWIYELAKPASVLLNVLSRGRDWIAWARYRGYYAGTPGGEQLMGWKLITSQNEVPAFYPARAFRKRLYRPDVIGRLLAEGSVEAALKKTKVKAAATSVEELLPPRVRITLLKPDPADKRKVTIEAVAESSVAGQPIQMLQLRVDGKQLPDNQGTKNLGEGRKADKVTWTIEQLPPGKLELRVMAFCPDVTGRSAAREYEVPEDPKNRPALHLVSIGLNYDNDADLKLDCPRNDATAIAKAFPEACVGPKNLFGKAPEPLLLLDKEATAQKVLAALDKVRKRVKPRDLLVLFYAGHGDRKEGTFYLLTHGANLNNLKQTALSGDALRQKLADFPCQVLLLLDACHSGQAAKTLRAATNEASRQLADEECAVTLLAAAMGHERALERKGAKNGLFTEALLRALGRVKEVSYNRRDGKQYVHHLATDVLDDVQHESKDRQHPFLSPPWTVESFPVRQVAQVDSATR